MWLFFQLGGENARGSGESRFFKRPMDSAKNEPNEQRSGMSEPSAVNCFCCFICGSKKFYFGLKRDGPRCKNVSPTKGGKHFSKQMRNICKKKVCKASKAQGKEQIAHETQQKYK